MQRIAGVRQHEPSLPADVGERLGCSTGFVTHIVALFVLAGISVPLAKGLGRFEPSLAVLVALGATYSYLRITGLLDSTSWNKTPLRAAAIAMLLGHIGPAVFFYYQYVGSMAHRVDVDPNWFGLGLGTIACYVGGLVLGSATLRDPSGAA